jgi:hypothetical protein
MRTEDVRPETPAQWLEHTEAWRYAHLDLAPSDQFRQMAMLEHERALLASVAGPPRTRRKWRVFRNEP